MIDRGRKDQNYIITIQDSRKSFFGIISAKIKVTAIVISNEKDKTWQIPSLKRTLRTEKSICPSKLFHPVRNFGLVFTQSVVSTIGTYFLCQLIDYKISRHSSKPRERELDFFFSWFAPMIHFDCIVIPRLSATSTDRPTELHERERHRERFPGRPDRS